MQSYEKYLTFASIEQRILLIRIKKIQFMPKWAKFAIFFYVMRYFFAFSVANVKKKM